MPHAMLPYLSKQACRWLRPVAVILPLAFVMIASLMLVPTAKANQPDLVARLDQNKLVEALENEGMTELLLHLLETEGESFEPVEVLRLKIATRQSQFNQPSLKMETRKQVFEEAAKLYAQIIENYPRDPRRVMWQTDYAEMLIFAKQRDLNNQAQLFYDFGVPTAEQEKAFESSVAEAFGQLNMADIAFFSLQRTIPARDDFQEKYQATGLWRTMNQQYYEGEIPFYTAYAAYYTALLPDDHPYYKETRNPLVPKKLREADKERRRLLLLAKAKIEPFSEDNRPGVSDMARTLLAQIELRLGNEAKANELATQIIRQDQGVQGLVAGMMQYEALIKQDKQRDAERALSQLENSQVVKSNLLYRLLVTDMAHKVALKQAQALTDAEARKKAIAQAYRPYEDLFNDPSVRQWAAFLRNFVFERWEKTLPVDAKFEELPPMVLLAVGQVATYRGNDLFVEASKQQGEEATATKEKAIEATKRGMAANEALLKRTDASPSVLATANYNLGLGQLNLDRKGEENQLKAASYWEAILADEKMRQQSIADKAAEDLMGLMRFVMSTYNPTPPDALKERYIRDAMILAEHLPELEATQNQRKYLGFMLQQDFEEYEKAAKVYEPLPLNHPDYWEVRSELMYCLLQMRQQAADGGNQAKAIETGAKLRQVATDLQKQAELAMKLPESRRPTGVKKAQLEANLSLAELYIETGQSRQALEALGDWRKDYEGQPQARIRAVRLAMRVYRDNGRQDEVIAAAKEFFELAPDQAAGFINAELNSIQTRVEELEQALSKMSPSQIESRRRATDELNTLAKYGGTLADLLIKWAQDNNRDMLPYLITRAKSYRIGMQPDKALELVKPLYEKNPRSGVVIQELAQSYLAMGEILAKENKTNEASKQFDLALDLFKKLSRDANPEDEKLAEFYWAGEIGKLETVLAQKDRFDKEVFENGSIVIKQLQNRYPGLGGHSKKFDALLRNFEATITQKSD